MLIIGMVKGELVLVTHYVIILAITGETTRSGELVITDKNFKVLSKINTFKKIKYPTIIKIGIQ